ncbi:sulfate ABC transporter ATP-binding protein [Xenophilus sp. AP218F]|nr:ABC transporter ATP-binding protein [Chromobacterium sp. ASV5]OWY40845.1 sulfate ABC transporter ATP-binding protein [Xenophilus sp. AP218F]
MDIALDRISKRFDAFQALDEVSLRLDAGRLLALLGPSGCGKSTLLRIIAGLEPADGGAVRLGGRDVTGLAPAERGVGMVFQHYALFRHLNVFDNIAFGLAVRPRRLRPEQAAIRRRVLALLEQVQLPHLADAYPAQLSGGQRQRVALARALAVEPKILLLDEPFGALDAKVRQEMRAWLRRLHDEIGVTSIFVTHDQDEALALADQVAVMQAGRIEQLGAPTQLYRQPATRFVAEFLGETNCLAARVDEGGLACGGLRFALDCGGWPPGAAVSAYVRPHEIELACAPAPGWAAGQVLALHALGPLTRLRLSSELGELQLALSQERAESMALAAGCRVYWRPARAALLPPA